MADIFRAFKVVSTLPAGNLTPNALYLVRVGPGFSLYATSSTGVAIPMNLPKTTLFTDRAAYDAYTPDSTELVFYAGP